ncbi:MAG TPA: NTF2-like N-terminal transpeptidase domain-containing protein, partial [Anaerolineaceae bacterium]|nr:NTF2-like N-terminal transpeptidase domain-containing protein [Anaerolineaceae bacterium]
MKRLILIFVIFSLLLSACDPITKNTETPTPQVTATLPSPSVSREELPDAEALAANYFQNWKIEDYNRMYEFLTIPAKAAYSLEDFIARHKKTAADLTMKSVDFQILSNLLSTNAAQVSYHISYETNLIGTLERDTLMNLQLEGGEWKINWDPSMMLPELADGNYLELVLTIPTRGNIYSSDASNNYPLVAYTDAASLTIIPGKINPAQEDSLVSFLAELTNQTEDAVRLKY